MCDCAEEQERRRRAEQQRGRSGSGAGGVGAGAGAGAGGAGSRFGSNRGSDGGSGGTGSFMARLVFGSSALMVGVLALLHKYFDIFGPLLEKYGFRPKKSTCNEGKKKFLDPNDPDPDRCDGLRIDPEKRRWPIEEK